jgi:hypothetical protein
MIKRTIRLRCGLWLAPIAALAFVAACGTDSGTPMDPGGTGGTPAPVVKPTPAKPGQTSFTTEDQNNPNSTFFGDARGAVGEAATTGAAPPSAPSADDDGSRKDAPGGRMGEVEEGDIYKMVGNRLYYLNTYKGFIVYDVTDPKKPVRLSRLPVFGYPIEMFVEGNTIYALLRDALYLTQAQGKLEFARHNVSQLVTIDISDVANPKILKTLDIIGQLREGVSRKVENTIYVVSYWNRWYWWGWGYERPTENRQDQAFVYAFDVSDRSNPKKTGELKIFEGGAVNFYDRTTGASFNRSFSGVWISATANALMVVENWYISASSGFVRGSTGCGYYNSDQQAVVSIVDISDPNGSIRVHTKFETAGSLTDQFKQTYVHDPDTGKGTYFGIFARRGWSSSDCSGRQYVQNTIEAWDVTNGENPVRVGRLDFGKPDETVRGTAFDVDRQVAYAITAQQIDPLYAISIADPRNLRILSEIDGLSGDISVFRLIGDKKFLLAVGRDNSQTCTGFDDRSPNTWGMNNIAVSIIDVQNLADIRLVQRQCVQVQNAGWVSSQVTWNLDQAHKMLGMHSDGEINVITVPVSYWKRNETRDWWYDNYETAVGIMSWDLKRYDPAKSHLQQTVIQNHGTFVHPNGEVRRSVLFTHESLKQRMMANLSDTHISLANIQNLSQPELTAIIEVAPYLNELFRFGNYIVEQVQPRTGGSWYAHRSAVEFRVKPAGGDIDSKAPVATFVVPQVQRAVKHGNQLVVFRTVPGISPIKNPDGTVTGGTAPKSEAVVFDLSQPSTPRLAGRVEVPAESFPYYRFYCGDYWGGYWFDGYYGGTSWADTAAGLVITRQHWDPATMRTSWKLMFLDLRNPDAPKVSERELALGKDTYLTALTVDAVDGRGFYLGYRALVGQMKREDGSIFYQWKDYAARWELDGDRWVQRYALNIPGRLIRTYRSADNERMLITTDYVSQWISDPATKQSYWVSWTRASLLREISLGGRPAAELMDSRVFESLRLTSLVSDGERLFVNGQRSYSRYTFGDAPVRSDTAGPDGGAVMMQDLSDRLMAFDLSGKKLALVYDQSTRMYNVQLMGVHQGRLFANLAGDGILIVDVTDAAKPVGLHFARTLGYATHIEFAGDDAYVGSGYFGTTHLDLRAVASLPVE